MDDDILWKQHSLNKALTSAETPSEKRYSTFKSLNEFNLETFESQPITQSSNPFTSFYSTLSTCPQSAATVLLISSSLVFALMQCSVRIATNKFSIPVFALTFYQSVIAVLLSAFVMILIRDSIHVDVLSPKVLSLLLLRGIAGGFAVIFVNSALSSLPVAVATSLLTTTPIFASVFAFFLLHEKMTGTDLCALFLTMLGTLLVTTLGESESNTNETAFPYILGVIFALAAAACIGSVYVLMRAMGTKVHFMLSVSTVSICSIFTSFLGYLITERNQFSITSYFLSPRYVAPGASLAILGVALFAFGGSMLVNRGSQLMPAGRAAILGVLDIPINVVLGFLILGELSSNVGEIVGCACMAASGYLIARQNSMACRNRETSHQEQDEDVAV